MNWELSMFSQFLGIVQLSCSTKGLHRPHHETLGPGSFLQGKEQGLSIFYCLFSKHCVHELTWGFLLLKWVLQIDICLGSYPHHSYKGVGLSLCLQGSWCKWVHDGYRRIPLPLTSHCSERALAPLRGGRPVLLVSQLCPQPALWAVQLSREARSLDC